MIWVAAVVYYAVGLRLALDFVRRGLDGGPADTTEVIAVGFLVVLGGAIWLPVLGFYGIGRAAAFIVRRTR